MEYVMKGRPKIVCPNCGARLMNAANKEVKNMTVAEMPEQKHKYDYFIYCKKCNTYIGIKSNLKRVLSNI